MLRAEVLRQRLSKLEEYLAILERLRGYGLEDFLADPERYGSAERFLQLSIEALSDMAGHLIAERNLGLVQQSRDLPRLLREHSYIDQDTRGTLDPDDRFPQCPRARLPGGQPAHCASRVARRPGRYPRVSGCIRASHLTRGKKHQKLNAVL